MEFLERAPELSVQIPQIAGISDAACVLVSQIGRPVADPKLADVRVAPLGERSAAGLRDAVRDMVRDELARLEELRESLLAERLRVF